MDKFKIRKSYTEPLSDDEIELNEFWNGVKTELGNHVYKFKTRNVIVHKLILNKQESMRTLMQWGTPTEFILELSRRIDKLNQWFVVWIYPYRVNDRVILIHHKDNYQKGITFDNSTSPLSRFEEKEITWDE